VSGEQRTDEQIVREALHKLRARGVVAPWTNIDDVRAEHDEHLAALARLVERLETAERPHFPCDPVVGSRGDVRGSRDGLLGTRWFIFYKPLGSTTRHGDQAVPPSSASPASRGAAPSSGERDE